MAFDRFNRWSKQWVGKGLEVFAGLLHHPLWAGIWIVALAAMVGAVGYRTAANTGLEQLAALANERLELYASNLEAELARHAYLPSLIALDLDVQALLDAPQSPAKRMAAQRTLARLNVRAGAIQIQVVDASGQVLATSDGQTPAGAVSGQVALALRDGLSAFFTVHGEGGVDENSATEHVFVHHVRRDDVTLGAVLVRISLAPLEATWVDLGLRSHSEKLLVVDEAQVVIMTSVPEWKYRVLGNEDSTPPNRAALIGSGRYPQRAGLEPLSWIVQAEVPPEARLVSVPAEAGSRPVSKLVQERAVLPLGVTLLTLSDPTDVWRNARTVAWGSAALGAAMGLLGLYLSYRRRAVQQLFDARNQLQLAYDDLERQVYDRTRELRQTNEELKRQIAQRLQTEDELMQAGKLAVLGQLSAGMSHELNQPLTAMGALATNSRRFLDQQRLGKVDENLALMAQMVERMGRITGQLKTFARKSEQVHVPVSLHLAIANVQTLLEHRLREESACVQVEVPQGLRVVCDGNRLEQVLLNLFGNALDAMRYSERRCIGVRALLPSDLDLIPAAQRRVTIQILDTGSGMDAQAAAHLFEPFFTTKPAGEGLGLGLVISSKIIHDFGGTLRLTPSEDSAWTGMMASFDLEVAQDV